MCLTAPQKPDLQEQMLVSIQTWDKRFRRINREIRTKKECLRFSYPHHVDGSREKKQE